MGMKLEKNFLKINWVLTNQGEEMQNLLLIYVNI